MAGGFGDPDRNISGKREQAASQTERDGYLYAGLWGGSADICIVQSLPQNALAGLQGMVYGRAFFVDVCGNIFFCVPVI